MSSTKLSARWKRRMGWLRNAPLILCVVALAGAIEALTWAGLYQIEHGFAPLFGYNVPVAPIKGAISLGCVLLGCLGSIAVQSYKTDPRPIIRRQAGAARILAVALQAFPLVNLADALAYPAQHRAWQEWSGSAAEAAVLDALERDPQDSIAREAAERSIEPTSVRKDGVWFMSLIGAGFLLSLVMLAPGMFARPAPETESQLRARLKAYAIAKRQETRLANLKAKDRPDWFRGVFTGIPNLRRQIATGRA